MHPLFPQSQSPTVEELVLLLDTQSGENWHRLLWDRQYSGDGKIHVIEYQFFMGARDSKAVSTFCSLKQLLIL